MNVDDAARELETLRDRLQHVGVLESCAHVAFDDALRALRIQKKDGVSPWSYRITRERPLRFRQTDPSFVKHRMSVDLFAEVAEPRNGIPQGSQSITARIWCHDKSLWYDPALDAPAVQEQVERAGRGRVMLRFRFDYDDPDDDHPWFHLQIGGQRMADELHRMPDNLARPRFLHHPMNLVMVCEFIVRHFYPEAFDKLAQEPSWITRLRRAQGTYLPRYLAHHLAYPRDCKASFLMYMWKIT